MKFLLVDHHSLFRFGMGLLLQEMYGSSTKIIEARNIKDAISRLKGGTEVNAVICDQIVPGSEEESWQLLGDLVSSAKDRPIIVVATARDSLRMQRMLQMGVKGYLCADTSPKMLRGVIEFVLAGGIFAPWHNAENAPASRQDSDVEDKSVARKIDALSPRLTVREREVIAELSTGATNKQIARRFGVTEGTIKAHLKAVYGKLGVHNRTEVAIRAARIINAPYAESAGKAHK